MTIRCEKSLTVVKSICVQVIAIFVAVALLFLIPLIVPVIIGVLGTYRCSIQKLCKWLRPDLSKIMTLSSTPLAVDILNPWPKLSIVTAFICEGTLDINGVKSTVTKNLIEGKFPNGEVKYPELKQYLTSWLGYFFWKDDESFDLDRHVNMFAVDGSAYSDVEIQDIYETLSQKPWTKNRPIWDMTLATNYYPKGGDTPHSVLFLRTHHCLADGYSLLRLIYEGLTEKKFISLNAAPKYVERNYCKSLWFWATFPFVSCFELAMSGIESLFPMPLYPSKKYNSEKLVAGLTDKISIHRIKEIKNHFGVSVSCVVSAVCTGALRDMMIIKGIKVPGVFRCGTVMPIPRHSEKLRNEFAVGFLDLATGETDPVKRLQFSSRDYKRLKNSAGAILATYFTRLGGFIPVWVLQHVLKTTPFTAGLTNFPGGFENMSMDGHKCVDTMFAAGTGPLGMNISALSYVDGLRISTLAKESVLTRREVDVLSRLFEKHVDILHEQMIDYLETIVTIL